MPGFSERDVDGRYHGLDVDICRALAAAILGSPDKVRFLPALSVADFLRQDDIDVVSRRLTWELTREGGQGLLFGPVTFYDGQSFLVSRRLGAARVGRLGGVNICVAGGTVFEANLNVYFRAHGLTLAKTIIESPHDYGAIANQLDSGRCRVYSGDVSDSGRDPRAPGEAGRLRHPRRPDSRRSRLRRSCGATTRRSSRSCAGRSSP